MIIFALLSSRVFWRSIVVFVARYMGVVIGACGPAVAWATSVFVDEVDQTEILQLFVCDTAYIGTTLYLRKIGAVRQKERGRKSPRALLIVLLARDLTRASLHSLALSTPAAARRDDS